MIKVRLDADDSRSFEMWSSSPGGILRMAEREWGVSRRSQVWIGCRLLTPHDVAPDGSVVDIDTRTLSPEEMQAMDKYELQDLMAERELLAKIALMAVEVAMHSTHPLTDSLLKAIKDHREWQLDRFGYSDDRFNEVRDLLVAMHEDMDGGLD